MKQHVYNGIGHDLEEYRHAYKNFFKDELKDGKALHTDMISG